MERTYFGNQQCQLCKASAKFFRLMGNFKGFLCENKECDMKVQIKEGFFKIDALSNLK